MDNLANALGVLGAYFALLLVLAVAVETILEPFTFLKWLRKKVNPEEFQKSLKDWITSNPETEIKIAEITNLTRKSRAGIEELQSSIKQMAAVAENTAQVFGITLEDTKKELLNTLYQYQYKIGEQNRIIILRCLSAGIGIVIAFLLKIDSFKLIADLLSQEALELLSTPLAHWGGMVLTGLAASAGSSFWHDQLAKARAIKTSLQK